MALYALPRWTGRFYRSFDARTSIGADERAAWQRRLEQLALSTATVARPAGNEVVPAYRGARVGWIHPDAGTRPIFDRLAALAEEINRDAFGFDLVGFAEPIQYAVYEAPSAGFDWHLDMIDAPSELQRKLSITVQLSDGADYDGGDLEVRDGYGVTTAPRDPGRVVAFPSWALHRVTPVSRGVRRSLVAWLGGPAFR